MTASYNENLVELRRTAQRWRERQHPRDSDGKFAERGGQVKSAAEKTAGTTEFPHFTRGQQVGVPVGGGNGRKPRQFGGQVVRGDKKGNYVVRVDNGVNGRRAQYGAKDIQAHEGVGTARRRRRGQAAARGLIQGAGLVAAGVGAVQRHNNARRILGMEPVNVHDEVRKAARNIRPRVSGAAKKVRDRVRQPGVDREFKKIMGQDVASGTNRRRPR